MTSLGLDKLPFFQKLPNVAVQALEHGGQLQVLEPGTVVIHEGEPARSLYCLVEGSVSISRGEDGEGALLETISAPTIFGEMAIVADTPRLATVTVTQAAKVVQIGRDTVLQATEQYPELLNVLLSFYRYRVMNNLLRQSPIFAPISVAHRRTIANSLETRHVEKGAILLRQGEPGSGLHVILRGVCEVVRELENGENWRSTLREGDCFGEISLVLFDQACSATVTAATDCVLLMLGKDVFQATVMSNPDVRRSVIKLALGRLHAQPGETNERSHLI